eukprot:CAMPEP_0174378524 /NCGR_PEP_ID=MMETSP0811_2-20130205/122106_1 /TAXON_ID=73025 ORGANISM="Eutreptiella gymnastica-like, Strain CCMP1594" /NCGR_SAMPLE_ID=MMETSP0811_2 /ASSEMBLY_ACC=CAM_ASM_000667 /LENGTH=172 /DNA_ID=CAMNT_0015530769 /DNA_START=860 /DNA_END=1378 /DNA_ORIENTATION=-
MQQKLNIQPSRAMPHLHARPALSRSSKTEATRLQPAQNRTSEGRARREIPLSSAMLHDVSVMGGGVCPSPTPIRSVTDHWYKHKHCGGPAQAPAPNLSKTNNIGMSPDTTHGDPTWYCWGVNEPLLLNIGQCTPVELRDCSALPTALYLGRCPVGVASTPSAIFRPCTSTPT